MVWRVTWFYERCLTAFGNMQSSLWERKYVSMGFSQNGRIADLVCLVSEVKTFSLLHLLIKSILHAECNKIKDFITLTVIWVEGDTMSFVGGAKPHIWEWRSVFGLEALGDLSVWKEMNWCLSVNKLQAAKYEIQKLQENVYKTQRVCYINTVDSLDTQHLAAVHLTWKDSL